MLRTLWVAMQEVSPRGHSGRSLVSHVPVKVLKEEAQGVAREEFLGREILTLKPSLVSLDPHSHVKSQAWLHVPAAPMLTRHNLKDLWSSLISHSHQFWGDI